MGKPLINRQVVHKSTYERITIQPPKSENQIVSSNVLKNRKAGTKTWMQFDASGNSEIFDCDRNGLLKRVTVPARDLRILGPIFSQSSHILARENAMVVNLEFVKAIITAEEVFFLDPFGRDVKPFVDQLRIQLNPENTLQIDCVAPNTSPGRHVSTTEDGHLEQLPFEFRILEIALDVVCNHLEELVRDLDKTARPALDLLTRRISTRSLELVRSIKSQLTHLSARVQKVRDELMQLLDDDEDMSDLYLTRKLLQAQHLDSPLYTIYSDSGVTASSAASRKLARLSSIRSHGHTSRRSSATQSTSPAYDVEELEMLLEAYLMQVDASLNKLSLVREYIDDTEDYVNVRLDHQRNQLFQFQITLGASALAIATATGFVGSFSMNVPVPPYDNPKWFAPSLACCLFISCSLFVGIVGYVRWKGLFEK